MSIAEKAGEELLGALIEMTIIERISYLKPIVEGKAPEGATSRGANDEALARWVDLGLRFREQRWMEPLPAEEESRRVKAAADVIENVQPRTLAVVGADRAKLGFPDRLTMQDQLNKLAIENGRALKRGEPVKAYVPYPDPPVEVLDELAAANEFGGVSAAKVFRETAKDMDGFHA